MLKLIDALYVVFFGLVFLLGVWFSYLNFAPVDIQIYPNRLSWHPPLAVALVVTLLIGVALGLSVRMLFYWRLRTRCQKLEEALAMAEHQLDDLRMAEADILSTTSQNESPPS